MADPSIAAIASEDTAALYGLKVIDREINESSVNTTRFAVFSRAQKEKAKSAERLILMFTVKNEVGALAKAVNIICAHGFNMNVLRSRPVKDVPWEYYFYVEAIGNQYDEEGVELLRRADSDRFLHEGREERMRQIAACCRRAGRAGAEGRVLSQRRVLRGGASA